MIDLIDLTHCLIKNSAMTERSFDANISGFARFVQLTVVCYWFVYYIDGE